MRDKLTMDQAAWELGISRMTLYRLRRKGLIGYIQEGRKIYLTREHVAEYRRECDRGAHIHNRVKSWIQPSLPGLDRLTLARQAAARLRGLTPAGARLAAEARDQ